MCYHASTKGSEGFKNAPQFNKFDIRYSDPDPYYHASGFTRPWWPVTLNNEPQTVTKARWKLLPFWVKDEDAANKYANTLNSDCDSIFQKKSYSPFIKKNRGLMWVNGFYEPHNVKGVKKTENYYIYKENKEMFSLGIVYANWVDKSTGNSYPTFSVIITAANELLKEVHNVKKRMPLIIPAEQRENWMKDQSQEDIKSFFKPYEGELRAHKVFRVTGARGINTNVPSIQDPI